MGRRSKFTPAQKRDAVLAVLSRRKTMAQVCRELGITKTTLMRWLLIPSRTFRLPKDLARLSGGAKRRPLQARVGPPPALNSHSCGWGRYTQTHIRAVSLPPGTTRTLATRG